MYRLICCLHLAMPQYLEHLPGLNRYKELFSPIAGREAKLFSEAAQSS
jgi:hypothetical protein